MKLAPLFLTLALTAASTSAQTFTDPANLRGERVTPLNGHELPIDKSEAEGGHGLAQLLRRLSTRASILNIVAHPDDEDGGMLALTSRGLGARVADLSLTRGEGGQNAMTADFEDALGLIRTQELLSSDRYPGIDQFFGTEVDFGFSKTKEESFQKWTHQRVLYDAVRAIRLYRPLVITATFVGAVTDGHGQHQVSGEIAQQAFVAAADPSVFPDMIAQGILPWQALRVYARVPFADINRHGVYDYATNQYVPAHFTNYVTGAVSTTKPTPDLIVPEGTPDPLLTTASACDSSALSTDPTQKPVQSTGTTQNSVLSTGAQRSGETCSSLATNPSTPLSYVQFARIGLGLQRTQITGNMRTPPAGHYDSPYHLYGSALCNAPASTRVPNTPCIPTTPTTTGAPHTSLGRSPGKNPTHETQGLKARLITATTPSDLTTQPNFFTGIDTSLEGIATLAPSAPRFLRTQLASIADNIATATHDFNPTNPSSIAPTLANALNTTDALINQLSKSALDPLQKANVLHELRIKRVQLNDALALALNLHLDATAPTSDLIAGTPATLHTALTETSTPHLTFNHLWIDGASPSQRQSLPTATSPLDTTWQIPAAHLATITRPYFTRDNIEQPIYQLRDPALRNAPQTPSPLTAWATLTYQGAAITLGRIVHTGPQPISIVPPVSIASAPNATVLPSGQTTAQLTATLHTDASTSANINVQSPPHWSITATPASASTVNFTLQSTATPSGPQDFRLTATTPDHHAYTEGYRPVGYPGLILTNDYIPATTRIVPVDLKLPAHLRIAYLPGTGDSDPEALASLGLAPTLLTVADLTRTNLAQFSTIILGVRTYAAHADLHGAPTQALLDYARNGGNVLVQYQTNEFTAADAPYPLTLGSAEKVVDETAPVQLLDPTSPLLTTPNRISPADFNHWIEERGHSFLSTWDPHYTPLLETHDPGGSETAPQLPQRGGLLTTPLGKGRWTYCAFALYRQLPEAVPGAYRLFLNLLTPTP